MFSFKIYYDPNEGGFFYEMLFNGVTIYSHGFNFISETEAEQAAFNHIIFRLMTGHRNPVEVVGNKDAAKHFFKGEL